MEIMKRRNFIQRIGISGALAPIIIQDPLSSRLKPQKEKSYLKVNTDTKIISYRGPIIPIIDLYRKIQDMWDLDLELDTSIMWISPNQFKMRNDWRLDMETIGRLNMGSINQDGVCFFSIHMVGNFDPKIHKLEAKNNPIEIDGCSTISRPIFSQPYQMVNRPIDLSNKVFPLIFKDRKGIFYETYVHGEFIGVVHIPSPYL